MLVVGITASTARHSVALLEGEELLGEISVGVPFRHAELLPKALRDVFALAGRRPADLDLIAVDVGPGLYTGLRAGIVAAKAFGFALSRPIVPVPSLWATGYAARSSSNERAIVVANARRGEVFWQIFPPSLEERAAGLAEAVGGDWNPERLGLRLGSAGDLVADMIALGPRLSDYAVVGEGARLYSEEISKKIASETGLTPPKILYAFEYPTGSWVASAGLALANLDGRVVVSQENVHAIYMRPADAKKAADRRPVSLVPNEVFI